MSDEWRVEIELGDEGQAPGFGERLRSLDLDDEARERLGESVIVTRDGSRIFLYAGTEAGAREAERVARELLAADGLEAKLTVTRWHPDAEEWRDAGEPLPESDVEREAERHEHESREQAEGEFDWEVRVDLPSLGATRELASRLEGEGLPVRRRWRYLLVPATTEEAAAELAERIRAEAPEGTKVHVEPDYVPHPAFVSIGAHIPGIGRDIGL
jgi:hypothetical protein